MANDVSNFFDKTENYLHKDFGVLSRMKFVRELLPSLEGKTILDVGCGDGRISLQFQKENWVTLVDQSQKMLDLAKANITHEDRVTTVCSELTRFVPKRKFDVVICVGLLAHLDKWKSTIHRIDDLVRPGGLCVLQISDGERWLTKRLVAPRGERKHLLNLIEWGELIRECRQSGMELEKVLRYGFLLPGMGRLPNVLLYHYVLFTSRFFLFKGLNTELIAIFKKVEKSKEAVLRCVTPVEVVKLADSLMHMDSATIGEPWTLDNFLGPRPMKWELSTIAFDKADSAIGFLIASRKGNSAHIHRLVIDRNHQRSGWGEKLVKQLEHLAGTYGLQMITLKVNRANHPAIAFYKSLGFRTTMSDEVNFKMEKPLA